MASESFNVWEDTEPFAKERDQRIIELAQSYNVEVECFGSHTLHDMIEYEKRLCKASKRDPSDEIKPPSSYTSFQKLFDQIGKPCLPIESPTADQMKPYKSLTLLGESSTDPMTSSLSEMGYEVKD